MSFTLQDAVLALKPINDDLLVSIIFFLPGNFAYVLNELHLNYIVNQQSDFNATSIMGFSSYAKHALNLDMRLPMPMLASSENGTGNNLKMYQAAAGSLWRTPMQAPDQVNNVSCRCSFANLSDTASTAGVINFEANFFEYDLDQIQNFPANYSPSVTTR